MLLLQLHIRHFIVLITMSKGIVDNKILTSLPQCIIIIIV